MKSSRHNHVEINAGSMADIAFLLLLFFLVATTISTDKGISRFLSAPCPDGVDCSKTVSENNLFKISLNENEEIMVNGEIVSIDLLEENIIDFLDNNADESCFYCNGKGIKTLSDNPAKATIALENIASTSYDFYINVQDKISRAYERLRTAYALQTLGKHPDNLSTKEIAVLQKAYPFNLAELETN